MSTNQANSDMEQEKLKDTKMESDQIKTLTSNNQNLSKEEIDFNKA